MSESAEYIILLADIHANELALLAVVDHARRRYGVYEPLRFWFLGDIFGRGPDAAGAWRRLLDLAPEASVAGNHDWGLLGRSTNILIDGRWEGEFDGMDWQVLLDQRKELGWLSLLFNLESGPNRGPVADYLALLPVVSVPRPGVFLVHGGLQTPFQSNTAPEVLGYRLIWEYVSSPEQAVYTLDALAALSEGTAQLPKGWIGGDASIPPAIVVLGHTHRRFLFNACPRGGGWQQPAPLDQGYSWRADPACPVLISPGSVGFSRERNSRAACYAVLRCDGNDIWNITFHEVPFDRSKIQDTMQALGRPEETIHLLDVVGQKSHAGASVAGGEDDANT